MKSDIKTIFVDDKRKSILSIALWSCIFIILCIVLQTKLSFHFFFIEQNQLFLFDKFYLLTTGSQQMGLANVLSDFCIQFFRISYCGAIISALLLTICGVLTSAVLKKILKSEKINLLGLIPVATFLFVLPDKTFQYSSLIAYIIMLITLYACIIINSETVKFFLVCTLSIAMFWCIGSVSIIFVLTIIIIELYHNPTHALKYFLPLLLIIIEAYTCAYYGHTSDFLTSLLPHFYFYEIHTLGIVYYMWWFSLPATIIIGLILNRINQNALTVTLQIIIAAVLFFWGGRYSANDDILYEELYHYIYNRQWEKAIEKSDAAKQKQNYLYDCCINIALAETGMLSDKLFDYNSQGIQSIYIPWDKTQVSSITLCELYLSMGQISLAQRMAFEANENAIREVNPKMMQHLIETNIIYGKYDVAEKYITILEKSLCYKKRATNYRRFINNEEAIKNNEFLNAKRKCLTTGNHLSDGNELDNDLIKIIQQNPAHEQTLQYLSALFLLNKDMENFRQMLATFYATDMSKALPKPYQEAIIIMRDAEPQEAFWKEFNIDKSILERYNKYKHSIETKQKDIEKNFGDTFWYYAMFKN